MTVKKILLSFLALCLLIAGLCSCGNAPKSVENNQVVSNIVQSTPIPTPTLVIPDSGEWVDKTTFSNVAFILDYQIVNGSILANMTEVYFHCYWNSDNHWHIDTGTANLSVDQNGDVSLQATFGYASDAPVQGTINFQGNYANGNFSLVTSDIVSSDYTGPVTLTFVAQPDHNALALIENAYQTEQCQ